MTIRTTLSRALALFCLLAVSTTLALAQRGPQGERGGFLTRALTEAGAPALTAEQTAKLTELSTALRATRKQTGPDEALQAAHKAYDAALLNGDLAGAQAQAGIIASRSAAHLGDTLKAEAQYVIDVANVLKSGGQWDALAQKFGADRLVRMLSGPGFGPGGGPGGGRPGFGPGFGPGGGPGGERGPGFGPRGTRPDNGADQLR
jgi:hypothetical protein